MKVELVHAWPSRFEAVEVALPDGACVGDALSAAGWEADAENVAYAVFGVRATVETPLHDGDRIELLRPLQADPKNARRQRAQAQREGKKSGIG